MGIFENIPSNTEYAIGVATDKDAAENGTVDYAIISGNENGKFRLGRNATECSINGFALCVITQGSLDREDVSAYHLNISASDRGKPSLLSFCLVNITIVDLNDNSPVFSQSLYNATVDENTPAGIEILAVTASDEDQALNGKVVYSFQSNQDSSNFQLNTSSGVIKTKEPLDYDGQGQKSYTFMVYARDQPGSPSFRQTSAEVVVKIQDVNDNTPNLQVFCLGKNPAEVPENAVNKSIASILINDNDDSSGPNGQVNVEISNGNGSFQLVFVTKTQSGGLFYVLKTATLLDREKNCISQH